MCLFAVYDQSLVDRNNSFCSPFQKNTLFGQSAVNVSNNEMFSKMAEKIVDRGLNGGLVGKQQTKLFLRFPFCSDVHVFKCNTPVLVAQKVVEPLLQEQMVAGLILDRAIPMALKWYQPSSYPAWH